MTSGPPPSAPKQERGLLPAPFIVGAPRSGTTLLRLMLDAHPALAMPPETGFLPAVLALRSRAGPEAFLSLVTGFETWPDFGLEVRDLGTALRDLTPFSLADAVRAFYRLYARRFGKRLWGDKTPDYGLHLPAIQSLLPEARFIHLIRDGRDVALSLRPLWFAPSRRMQDLARHWVQRVSTTRALGRGSPPYLEVRFEDLVRRPADQLALLCRFLDLDYDPAMLRYHERASTRLDEHQERRHADGTARLTRAERRSQQWRTQLPPDLSRIACHRSEMTPKERRAFEGVAGGLLRELGYEVGD